MKILIADDDDTFRSLTAEILSNAGYEVATEPNGLLAWEHLRRDGADMVILDVNMPEMDGFEVLRKIRADERLGATPIAMFTIKALTEDQIAGYDYGADEYIIKPFDTDLFVAKIKTLARRLKPSDK